ncbi:MAG: HAD-IIA family hydrolase [bacterium]|nr:HAD-IIA family hydrolase [bacterium]
MTGLFEGHGPIDTVVCDIDGVLVLGNEPIPGAGEALDVLRIAGFSIVLVTNNSTRTTAMTRRHVHEVTGFDPGPDHVISSGMAAARHVRDVVSRAYVLGADGLRETLRDGGVDVTLDWREADAVVSGMDFEVSYEALAHAGLAIQNGATFYATNDDVSYPRPDGLYPGAGALQAVLQSTTGVAPIVCGKPYPPMRDMLEEVAGRQSIVVGDRPDTDIALGKVEGWATALVLTGVTRKAENVPPELSPTVVLESIAALPSALGIV